MSATGSHAPVIWRVLILVAASSMMTAAPACRTYETPPPDVASAQIIGNEAFPDYTYPLDLGTLRHCGSCGEMAVRCPRYDVLKRLGWVAVSCEEGVFRAALTDEGKRLFHVPKNVIARGPSRQYFVVLARWEFAGIVRMEGQPDGWATVVYRWRYAPTEAGRRFLEWGYPEPPLGDPACDASRPPGPLFEGRASFLKRQGTWSYMPPLGGSSGGIYVH